MVPLRDGSPPREPVRRGSDVDLNPEGTRVALHRAHDCSTRLSSHSWAHKTVRHNSARHQEQMVKLSLLPRTRPERYRSPGYRLPT